MNTVLFIMWKYNVGSYLYKHGYRYSIGKFLPALTFISAYPYNRLCYEHDYTKFFDIGILSNNKKIITKESLLL